MTVPGGALHALREAGAATLVHGKAVPHTCTTVHQWPKQQVGTAALQPAHSPDTVLQGNGASGAIRDLPDRALPMYAWWADLVTDPQTLLFFSEPEADFHSG